MRRRVGVLVLSALAACAEDAPPTAQAGADQTVDVLQTVRLNGATSSDPEGASLGFKWTMVERPSSSAAVLAKAAGPRPSFVADAAGAYVVELVVNDGAQDSLPDRATITAQVGRPLADAGGDVTVAPGTRVTLDGSKSRAADGSALAYRWRFVSQPAMAGLDGADTATASFVADPAGTYVVSLVVSSGGLDSEPDEVRVIADPGPAPEGLIWPVDCAPGIGQCDAWILHADPDGDGQSYECNRANTGHEGTDISPSFNYPDPVPVRAAAEGTVRWVFDGKFDQCPDPNEPDCQAPSQLDGPGVESGYMVCTEAGPYCGTGTGRCYWCFWGANVVVIEHSTTPGVFATRYDHLKRGSIMVAPGDRVTKGQLIAYVGSAGRSSNPHLHFEVWGSGYYEVAEPWVGPCGRADGPVLWAYDPPWSEPGRSWR